MPAINNATAQAVALCCAVMPRAPRKSLRAKRCWILARYSRCSFSVDLPPEESDRALIDRGGVPRLDGGEVRLTGLISRTSSPAMCTQKIRRRGERRPRVVEAAPRILKHIPRQELCMPNLAVHG